MPARPYQKHIKDLGIIMPTFENFCSIRHTRADKYKRYREVNRALWRKNEYWVTVTLTFDPRSFLDFGDNFVDLEEMANRKKRVFYYMLNCLILILMLSNVFKMK